MAQLEKVCANRWLPSGEAIVEGKHPTVLWRGIPGETVKVRVDHRGRHRTYARVVSAHPPDPHRVEPPCKKMDPCGGCPLMHLDGAGQALAQRSVVRDALASEGLDVEIGLHHRCPDGLARYRHVAKVGVGYSDLRRLRVGAWGRRDRRITPIPDCSVISEPLRQTMKAVAHHVIALDIWPYEPESDRGVLRAVVMRSSRVTGEVLVTLVAGRRNRRLVELAEEVSQAVSAVSGVWLHLNDEIGNHIFARDEVGAVRTVRLCGRGWIEEHLNDVQYRIGPGDFFQTNPSTAETLYQRVVARLEAGRDDAVVDLYCGVGGIALQVARTGAFVIGVEEIEGAALRAREAARLNRLRAEFVARRVDEALPELQRRLVDMRPLVIVNPARRGLEEGVIPAIAALKPRRVVYVSCNPRALARDLTAWIAAGFNPGPIELFDMFPNTAHVECLVTLDASEPGVGARRAPRRRVVRRR